MLRLLHVELFHRIGRDHGNMLFMHCQPEGGIKCLRIGTVNDHVFTHRREHEALHIDHGNTAVTGNIQLRAFTTHCQDQGIRRLRFDQLFIHRLAGHNIDAVYFELADEVLLEVGQILMRAFYHIRKVKQTAEDKLALIECNIMATLRCNPGCLHTCRSAADNHDFLHRVCLRNLVGRRSAFTHDTLCQRIDTAISLQRIHFIAADVAVQAACAGSDLIDPALAELVDVFRVDRERTRHHKEVALAVFKSLLKEVRCMGGIHVSDHTAGDLHCLLVHGGDVQRHAGPACVSDQLALPMTLEIILRAKAGRSFNAVEDEVKIRAELSNMMPERSETEMHGVRSGRFEELGKFDPLFHHGDLGVRIGYSRVERHERRVVGDIVILLNAVNQNLNVEVLSDFFFDSLDPFRDKPGTIFNAADAVFVLSGIINPGEEVLAHVEAGGIHFNCFEAHLLEILCNGNAAGLDGMDIIHRHVIFAAAELGPLIAEAGAVLPAFFRKLLAECDGLFRHGAAVCRGFESSDALHPDHLDAALGEIYIILQQLVCQAFQIACGAGS